MKIVFFKIKKKLGQNNWGRREKKKKKSQFGI